MSSLLCLKNFNADFVVTKNKWSDSHFKYSHSSNLYIFTWSVTLNKKRKVTVSFLLCKNLWFNTNAPSGSLCRRYQQAPGDWMNLLFSLLPLRLFLKGSSTHIRLRGEWRGSMETSPTHKTSQSLDTQMDIFIYSSMLQIQCQNGTHSDVTRLYKVSSNPTSTYSNALHLQGPKKSYIFQFHLFLILFLLVYQISLWKPKWKPMWFRQKWSWPL